MTSELKLDEGLCRCCHAQGMFQNLSTPFVCQGQEEIFSEMLRDCFDIAIKPLEGEYSTSTYTICITCALKLRDASEFKKQVLECEERFKEVCKEVMKSLEPMDIDIKVEIEVPEAQSIKEEPSDDMDTGAEENYEIKFEEPKDEFDRTLKGTQKDDNKGKRRNLRVTSNKGKPAVKVKRQNRIGMPKRQKKSSNDSPNNETDSPKSKSATVTSSRKKIAEKKLVNKSYKKDDPLRATIKVESCDIAIKCRVIDNEDVKLVKKRNYDVKSTVASKKILEEDSDPMSAEATSAAMSRKDLLYHVLTVQEEDLVRYMCTKCDKLFAKTESCLFHLKNKHFRGPFACPVCGDALVNKTYKAHHLALKHGKEELETEDGTVLVDCRNTYPCGVCEKTFPLASSLRSHLRFHKKKQCQYCGLTLRTVPAMTKHLHDVHGEEIPTCGICGYMSRKKNDVLSHQRKVHMKEKTVKCEVCDERFFSRPKMLYHMVKHNPEKKFECEFCHKKYPRLNTLNEHRKIHKGIKNKVCQVCGQKFVQKASLNYHMAKRHPDVQY